MTEITFKEYFDALFEEGEVLGLKCSDCEAYTCPPKSTCDGCGGRDLVAVTLSGRGRIRTFTTTYTPPAGYEEEGPYVTALAELEEGPWIPGRVDIDPERADEIGQDLIDRKVTVQGKGFPSEQFYPDKDRRVVPIFKLSEE